MITLGWLPFLVVALLIFKAGMLFGAWSTAKFVQARRRADLSATPHESADVATLSAARPRT